MRTFRWLEMLLQDLRYAVRTLTRSPGFTLVAALTLALGIGANTAIFSMVNAVMLRPLPYLDASRLVMLIGNVKRTQVERRGTSSADYLDWRNHSRSFDGMAIVGAGGTVTLTGSDETERAAAEYVGQPYFGMLGANAAIGRTFRPDEDEVPQRNPVAVISDGIWKRRFGGDPGIAGRTIMINDQPFTVVGVMPPWFRGVYDNADIWVPFMMAQTAQSVTNRGNRGPWVLAKLRQGIPIQQAQTEMNAICKRLEEAHPGTNEGRGVEISPLERELLGDLHTPLVVLLAAVSVVLLIACTNVANLLLARSQARQREIAVRTALGASRARMLLQLTTESFVLVFAGAATGLLLAHWAVGALVAASPITFPSYIQPSLDLGVALFTVAISCATALLLGLAPAIHVRAGNLNEAVKQAGSRTVDSRAGRRFRNALVTAEVGFAMLLLVGAGLLIRSMRELATIRPGYDPSHLLTLRVSLPRLAAAGTSPDGRAGVMARDLLAAAGRVPSVDSVAISSDAPLSGGGASFYTAEGQPPVNASNVPRGYTHRVSPGFFHALRIRFVAGRTFTEGEVQPDSTAVIVSENVARRFWSGQDPIGKRIRMGGPGTNAPWMNIVGVVSEMKYRGLPNNPTADPDLFLPFAENTRNFMMVVRTALDPASIVPSLRTALRATDSTMVVYAATTMQELIAAQTARNRFTGWIMGIFAGAALMLATIGIYGVISYAVSRRTQEIGIRIALGAARGEVLGMVVSRGMTLVAAGLTLGTFAALGLTRLLGTLLYGVTFMDAFSFAGSALVLAAVALFACLIPAFRASRIDPAIALRNE